MVKKKPTHRRISSPVAGEGEKKVAEGTETREKLPVAVAENPGRKVSSFLTAKQKKKKKRKNLHLNRESANPGFEKRGASGSVFLLTCTLVFCVFFFFFQASSPLSSPRQQLMGSFVVWCRARYY